LSEPRIQVFLRVLRCYRNELRLRNRATNLFEPNLIKQTKTIPPSLPAEDTKRKFVAAVSLVILVAGHLLRVA